MSMNRDQYKKEMEAVGGSSLGLEMINHANKCKDCMAILMEANQKVVSHIRQTQG